MKPFLFLIACATMYTAFGQGREDKFNTYDQNLQPVTERKATYFQRIRQKDKKTFIRTLYNIRGPRISEESFSDKEGKIRNGQCLYYHTNGALDSCGEYTGGVINGLWRYFASNGNVIREKNYDGGVLTRDTLFAESLNEMETDVKNGHVEVPAQYSEGVTGWARFLNRTLRYPERAQQLRATGRVVLQFFVDENGHIMEPDIKTSVEYSLDEEALRIIQLSTSWSPATKDGIKIKSRKFQPMIFRLE